MTREPAPSASGADGCTFCGMARGDARLLVQAPKSPAAICDACIDQAHEMVHRSALHPHARGLPAGWAICPVCRKDSPPDRLYDVGGRGAICNSCYRVIAASLGVEIPRRS